MLRCVAAIVIVVTLAPGNMQNSTIKRKLNSPCVHRWTQTVLQLCIITEHNWRALMIARCLELINTP